jgi:hypothetical protein
MHVPHSCIIYALSGEQQQLLGPLSESSYISSDFIMRRSLNLLHLESSHETNLFIAPHAASLLFFYGTRRTVSSFYCLRCLCVNYLLLSTLSCHARNLKKGVCARRNSAAAALLINDWEPHLIVPSQLGRT